MSMPRPQGAFLTYLILQRHLTAQIRTNIDASVPFCIKQRSLSRKLSETIEARDPITLEIVPGHAIERK